MSTKPPRPVATTDVAGDRERLLALWAAAGLSCRPGGRDSLAAFERQQASGLQTILGVETEDGRLVGAVVATHDGRKGWINRLAVHPDHRRRGIARELLRAAEEVLRRQGLTVIGALIEPENRDSLAVFRAAGYVAYPGLHYVSKRESADS